VGETNKFTFPIIFEFMLEAKFPFVFPKLFCRTNFFNPSLADGRDFTNVVCGKMWTPAILLKDITIMLPKLIKQLFIFKSPLDSQLLGEYHLGHFYNLEDFLAMDSIHSFSAHEFNNNVSASTERFLIVAESYFLNFEMVDKKRNTIKLLAWSFVQSLASIKKSKKDPTALIFTWHDRRQGQQSTFSTVFKLDQADDLIEIITNSSKRYSVKINKIVSKFKDLKMEEVTLKNYQNMDIDELLDNIEYLESRLSESLQIDIINLLMNLYQKAVEYFSAYSEPRYNEYMQRMHIMLQREDIAIVLQSKQEDEVPSKSNSNDNEIPDLMNSDPKPEEMKKNEEISKT
jgi:ACT domain-containing protein